MFNTNQKIAIAAIVALFIGILMAPVIQYQFKVSSCASASAKVSSDPDDSRALDVYTAQCHRWVNGAP